MDIALLLLALAGLWFGTELTIRGSVSLAKRFGVSEFLVGVAVLSVGSDLPELAIAVDAALKISAGGDFADVVVGSALGSSLGQIGFVMGCAGLLAHLTLPRRVVLRHGGILLGSLLLLGVFAVDGSIGRVEGLVLILFYAVYIAALLRNGLDGAAAEQFSVRRVGSSVALLLVGLVIVGVSADQAVTSAIAVARMLGIGEDFVAIVLIGLGSSLPELSISVGAVLKGQKSLSVGNLIGSNIFDTLVPIGAAAVIADLAFSASMLRLELPVLFVLSTLVLAFFLTRRGVRRPEAVLILGSYVAFVAFKLAGN